MKQISKVIILISIVSLTFSGCTKVAMSLYGMKNIKKVNEKAIFKYGEKYNVPKQDSYELDTAYFTFLFSLDTLKYKSQIKNHYQPLQALYYDNNGQLKSFQINCYAGGFPNLDWDRDGAFATFLPKQQAPPDSIVSLNTQLKYLHPLSKTEKFENGDYDYVVVILWNRFMGRQSKRLINFVQENAKLAGSKKVKILYANTDDIFARQN